MLLMLLMPNSKTQIAQEGSRKSSTLPSHFLSNSNFENFVLQERRFLCDVLSFTVATQRQDMRGWFHLSKHSVNCSKPVLRPLDSIKDKLQLPDVQTQKTAAEITARDLDEEEKRCQRFMV